jgi:general secretion pathway protein D
MKRPLLSALLLALSYGASTAQESATGGQAGTPAPAPAASSRPSGLLTPPPDNAPSVPETNSAPALEPVTPPPAPTTTTRTRSTTTSRSDVARIQEQEVIRRQELVFRANQSLDSAQRSELAQDYPNARKDYLFAVEAYGSISRATISYAKAAEGLTRVDFALYDDALRIGDTRRAKLLIDEVIKYNPNNQLAIEKEATINRALANPNDTSLFGNAAVTPGFVDRVNRVQQLFIEAEQFRRTGQWDEAESRLKRILGIDPYNISATKELERIDAEKNQYADVARLETRDERLRQVEEKWYEPINNADVTTGAQESQPALTRATNFNLDQKLSSIFMSLNFDGASIEEATSFLSSESKRLDPDHKGVNFIIQPEASTSAKPITLTLNNVPLGEALRYICQLANVKYKVEDYAISIVPFNASTEDLVSRTFNVQPSFVAPPAASGTIESASAGFSSTRRPVAPTTTEAPTTPSPDEGDTVRAALEAKGVKFAAGASAVYTPTTGQLTVVDTADQMELLEELVNAGQAPTLMVRIASKFVEINQTDLNDLTFNTGFNLFDIVTGLPVSTALGQSKLLLGSSYSSQLAGANNIASDSINQLISPQVQSFNSFTFKGIIGHRAFNVFIDALSQKKSADLLNNPAVLVKSGEQGTLEAVRVFPYPIAFDPPELVTQTTSSLSTTVVTNPPVVIATTPTDFKRRNVGVRLVVKPQVASDNQTVDLSLFPEVTQFDGFINYGSVINIANPDNTTSLLSTNDLNQPVFDTRRITTKVLIHDGSTVVLGGLLNDNVQTVNDRVPLLGDLPLVGRLFQSKANESIKRNLIIFVTANIYQNDGELLNPPEVIDSADVLMGRASVSAAAGAP